MKVSVLKTHSVLVAGFGVTGESVARFLVRNEIPFDVCDECNEHKQIEHSRLLQTLTGDSTIPQFYNVFSESLFSQYSLIILSPGISRKHRAVKAGLSNGAVVIGDIELFASAVSSPVIAVTGSNGKSTVVAWLAHTLKSAGVNAVACGNIGDSALDSLTLAADIYVLELSSYQLESTYSLSALSATVLNISEDHLDRYEDIEHYANVKRRLYEMSKHCVANLEDRRTWPDQESEKSCEYFSLSKGSTSKARWHRLINQDQTWLCDAGTALVDETALAVPGQHNVANALAVVALVHSLGIEFARIKSGLIDFPGLKHRSQYLGEHEGVRWYNDSKGTNVDACIKAVMAMPGPVILIAGGIAKGADFTPLRDVARTRVKILLLLGRDREQIAEQLDGAVGMQLVSDLSEAVVVAKEHAHDGDVVLLSPACSSFDMFENFEARGDQFVSAVAEVLAA